MPDSDETDERRSRPPQEGVRIIGAEEAAAALEKGEAEGRRPEDAPRFGDVPPAPSGPRLVHRFPLPDTADPTVSIPKPTPAGMRPDEPITNDASGSQPDDAGLDEAAESQEPLPDLSLPEEGLNVATESSPDLPHWTEPPTGEVPKVLIGEDDDAAWSGVASRGPRWRDSHSDWDDDLGMAELADDDDVRVGALDETRTEHSDLYDFGEPRPSGPTPAVGPEVDDTNDDFEELRAPSTTRIRTRRVRPPRPADDGTTDQTEMTVRVLTGLAILILGLVAFSLGTATTAVLATVVVTACAFEVFTVLRRAGYLPAIPIGLLATVSIMAGAYWKGERAIPLVMVLTLMTTMLWYLFEVVRARATINVMVTIGAFTWVGGLGSFACLLLVGAPSHHGLGLLMGAVLATVGCDVGSLIAGRAIGNHPLMPEVSPNKTWEGVLGGLTGSVLVSVVVVAQITPWNVKHAALLGLVVAVVSPLGDLCESMVKRDLSLKDMGSILPGHGGVLDRFDGMLFVLPAAYYLAIYLNIH